MTSLPEPGMAAWPRIEAGALARRIAGLQGGERLTVIGVDRDGLGDLLAQRPDETRGALLVSCRGLASAAAILDRLLDDLADLALGRWPDWAGHDRHGQGDPSDAAVTGPSTPPSFAPWMKAAAKRARAGQPPRFRRLARELAFVRLLHAINPAGVLLVWEVDPASEIRARPVIEAVEWCARHGAVIVTALSVPPPERPPYDRILYGAHELARAPRPASERFIAPLPGAHHASAAEQRVAAALAQDSDLAGLFVCNAPVPVGDWGARHRVDLLCGRYRVVVELDGPEHRAEPKFSADRHRDYELLTAGYLVLRLTNDQVTLDLARAIAKIRAVVDLRRREE